MASQSALRGQTPSWGDSEATPRPGCLPGKRRRANQAPDTAHVASGTKHRVRSGVPSLRHLVSPPTAQRCEPAGGRGGLAPSFKLCCSEAHSAGLSPRPGGPRGSVGSWRGLGRPRSATRRAVCGGAPSSRAHTPRVGGVGLQQMLYSKPWRRPSSSPSGWSSGPVHLIPTGDGQSCLPAPGPAALSHVATSTPSPSPPPNGEQTSPRLRVSLHPVSEPVSLPKPFLH